MKSKKLKNLGILGATALQSPQLVEYGYVFIVWIVLLFIIQHCYCFCYSMCVMCIHAFSIIFLFYCSVLSHNSIIKNKP